MRYTALGILLLVVSEPLLIHAKKLVVVFPRQIRRSPGPPWRSGGAYYKKTSHGNGEGHQHVYHSRPPQYYPRRPIYRNQPFPHGADDFDQGHETANHVHVPYGKDVRHAITYGKGYVPYDGIKGSFSFGRESSRYPQMVPSHKHPESSYASTNFSPGGSGLAMHLRQVYDNPHADMHFSDGEGEYHERRNDRKNKYNVGRSIERDLGVRTHVDLNSPVGRDLGVRGHVDLNSPIGRDSGLRTYVDLNNPVGRELGVRSHVDLNGQIGRDLGLRTHVDLNSQVGRDLGVKAHVDLNSQIENEKEQLQKGTEIYKEVLPQRNEVQGGLVVPGGIPPVTIGGSKDGFVFSDSISLDAYHKQMQELTKTWPSLLTGGAGDLQSQQVYATVKYPTAGLPGSSLTGSAGWLADFAQPKQGYAVKEELAEPSHDFRNMQIQTAPFQGLTQGLPLGISVAMTNPVQTVHG